MLLLAAEWVDGAVRLFTARNINDGITKAAQHRNNELPSHIWVLTGERRAVNPTGF